MTAWVSEVAAVAGAVVALSTFVIYVRVYRRDVNDRRQRQAELISAWASGPDVIFKNASTAPVYHVIATAVDVRGPAKDARKHVGQGLETSRAYCDPLLPGQERKVPFRAWGGGGAGRREDVEIAFTDNVGRHWCKPRAGELRRLRVAPLRYYGFGEPIGWSPGVALEVTHQQDQERR